MVELCQRPMVLQGRVEKRLCSCVLGRWPVLTLSPAQVGMVGDFSVFGVFSAVAEFRGQGPCDCKVVCAYVGGGVCVYHVAVYTALLATRWPWLLGLFCSPS